MPNLAFLQKAVVQPSSRFRSDASRRQGLCTKKWQASSSYGRSNAAQSIPKASEYAGPVRPADFAAPKPSTYGVSSGSALTLAQLVAQIPIRGGMGATVQGFRPTFVNGQFGGRSDSLPRQMPKQPLELYELEACGYCRKVRESISCLDIDAYIYPCPKGGKRFRPEAIELGGLAQFPYLVDPNTNYSGYESDVLVKYLFETYGGDGRVPLPLALGPLTQASILLALSTRAFQGTTRPNKVVYPKKFLTLWAYEASPFCKLVRERLTQYEVPHLLRTAARGSRKTEVLQGLTGRYQVPYLIDPNTGCDMFESSYILEYLDKTYGPNAPNAVIDVPEGLELEKPEYSPGI